MLRVDEINYAYIDPDFFSEKSWILLTLNFGFSGFDFWSLIHFHCLAGKEGKLL